MKTYFLRLLFALAGKTYWENTFKGKKLGNGTTELSTEVDSLLPVGLSWLDHPLDGK